MLVRVMAMLTCCDYRCQVTCIVVARTVIAPLIIRNTWHWSAHLLRTFADAQRQPVYPRITQSQGCEQSHLAFSVRPYIVLLITFLKMHHISAKGQLIFGALYVP